MTEGSHRWIDVLKPITCSYWFIFKIKACNYKRWTGTQNSNITINISKYNYNSTKHNLIIDSSKEIRKQWKLTALHYPCEYTTLIMN